MADSKLVGQDYTTPDLRAKVTGRSKYAEDFRAEGMLFTKLLLSPRSGSNFVVGRFELMPIQQLTFSKRYVYRNEL